MLLLNKTLMLDASTVLALKFALTRFLLKCVTDGSQERLKVKLKVRLIKVEIPVQKEKELLLHEVDFSA
jgi:hypothetical protein